MSKRVWNPNIEDLHKYILDLEAEVERLKKENLAWVNSANSHRERASLAEAALARVRAALEKIAEVDHIGRDHAFDVCCEIARAALEGR